MGVLSNKGLLSTKYVNAIIRDSGNRFFVVHLKHYLGDYFVTTLDNQPYAFKVVGSEILTYNETAMKNIRIVNYSTKHYRPISDMTDAIKHVLEKNGLPRINMNLFETLKTLGKREKRDFKEHNVAQLIEDLLKQRDSKAGKLLGRESKYKEAATDVIELLSSLDTEKIVTPTREISNYIEDDLIATDAGYYGTVITSHQRTDLEHKKITNTSIGAKKPIALVMAVIFGIGLMGVVLYMAYDSGMFDDLTAMIPDISDVSLMPSTPPPGGNILVKYPTPESAKAAIDAGEVSITAFPPEMRDSISKIKIEVSP